MEIKKRYWHRLSMETIKKLKTENKTWKYAMKNFKQPDWCSYPDALSGVMGCWSLVYWWDLDIKINKKFCKDCDCYIK